MKTSKLIGGVLLIVGTSIGGGMLALPMATAAGGFLHSTLLFLAAWLVTVLAAFYILEVNLWLPAGANLVSMAKATLGKGGQVITWLSYLLLLYSLLSAYTAGGADLVQGLFLLLSIHLSLALSALIFIVVLGVILFFGVTAVDHANRLLMTIKLAAYLLLVSLIMGHVDFASLAGGHVRLLAGAVMVVITSFGYATIVPTLRSYFDSDVKSLRLVIAVGSLIPLLCYLLWDMAVQGSLESVGGSGLIQMAHSGRAVSELTNALSTRLNSHAIYQLTHLFTSICIATSFLGVSLCMTDFFADGLGLKKIGWRRWLVVGLSLLPPLLLVLVDPGIFIKGLEYAGVFCVALLILLPALMVWSGRYIRKISSGYQVVGGKPFVIVEMLLAIMLLLFAFFQLS